MLVLVLNSGSSSVKFQLLDADTGTRHAGGAVEEVTDHGAALRSVVDRLGTIEVDAVGHRVVHGGEQFTAPTVIDDRALAALTSVSPLAPLHNPANLEGIRTARRVWPRVPHVAVFDTAFHRTLPAHAYRYAVPSEWYERYGVRRYGFHGTSHRFVAGQVAAALGRPLEALDLVVAHLGNGASITAIHAGASVDTSMGLSPLEGLVMGTRSGDVDPTVVIHMAEATGRSCVDILGDLNRASGMLGLCGASDVRTISERYAAGDESARLAIDVFAHRVKKYVGAYLAVLGRCDAIAFTGGIGEHSVLVRGESLRGLDGLGIVIDVARNARSEPVISADGSPIAVLVVATDEEREIACQVAATVGA